MNSKDPLDYKAIGERIRRYRRQFDMTQEMLAEKVDISAAHMSHIETGSTHISLPVLVKIAETLDVSVDTLLYDRPKLNKSERADRIQKLIDSSSVNESRVLYEMLTTLKQSIENNLPETHRRPRYADKKPHDEDNHEDNSAT